MALDLNGGLATGLILEHFKELFAVHVSNPSASYSSVLPIHTVMWTGSRFEHTGTSGIHSIRNKLVCFLLLVPSLFTLSNCYYIVIWNANV
jgi:hypothetical protein